MPWYATGTVSVTANSATVTGTGTAFSANARTGDAFRGPDGRWYEITNIASATVLSIRPNYQGATASGQAYTIAPMQGYVKESADRLRQLVDQFGAQLAALQPWATAPTPAQAREALGANDAASLTAGLLNVARIPATLTPDKAYRRGNILGTVSQLSGVPTGAIIERGSNANGEYVRFADGTQITRRQDVTNVTVLAGTSVDIQDTPAAAFVGNYETYCGGAFYTGADATGIILYSLLVLSRGNHYLFNVGNSPANYHFSFAVGTNNAESVVKTAVSVGRWY